MIIHIVESNMVGGQHSGINTAVAAALLQIAEQHPLELHFWGERHQYETISAGLKNYRSITYHPITVIPGSSRQFIRKVLWETLNIYRILRVARRTDSTVLFLSVFAPSMVALMLLRPYFRAVKAHLILHSLDGLLRQDKQRLTSYGLWNRISLLKLFDGSWPATYVLGEGIRSRLTSAFPEVSSLQGIKVIEHPFDFDNGPPPKECGDVTGQGRLFRVGFVGGGRMDKGIDRFYRLGEMMSNLIAERKAEFVLVGALAVECGQLRSHLVKELHSPEEFVSSLQYQQEVGELDFAVFMLDERYSLTASSSVLDAISASTKILSLRNPYICDLSKEDVENGIVLFDNLVDMERYLRMDIQAGTKEHPCFSEIKRRRSVECTAKTLSRYLVEPQSRFK